MRELEISLKSIEDVKKFVQTIAQQDGEFEVISGKYTVDAKSILGLFSVDLSKPVMLRINVDEKHMEEVLKSIAPYKSSL